MPAQANKRHLDVAKAYRAAHIEPVAGFLNAHLHAGGADEIILGGGGGCFYRVAQFREGRGVVVQPLKGLAFRERSIAVFHRELAVTEVLHGGLLLLRVAQQAMEYVALGGFFQAHAHRLVGAQGHEVRAVAEAQLEMNLLGFGPRE